MFINAENPLELVKVIHKTALKPDPEANEEGNDGEKQEEENACLEWSHVYICSKTTSKTSTNLRTLLQIGRI